MQAFLNMPTCRLWGERLNKFGINKMVPNGDNYYEKERELRATIKNTTLGVVYY